MRAKDIQRNARALVRAVLAEDDWYQDMDMDGNHIERQFIGTVFAVMPSGKYYTAWASSNLTPCPRCKGEGQVKTPRRVRYVNPVTHKTEVFNNYACPLCEGECSREAHEDTLFMEAMEAEASALGCWIESGEGDPCDLFLARSVETDDEEEQDE